MFSSRFPETPLRSVLPSYDYIVVGGGTAGCVLANRLTQDPDVTVLLIERGGVQNNFISRVPLLSSHFASDGSRSHVVPSAPQKHLNGRQLDVVSGKSLGGASKINAMMYTRGLPAEYDSWEAMGNEGWGYRDVLPYFIKTENYLDGAAEGKSPWHGTKGEWPVQSHPRRHWKHTDEIIKACSSMGVPYVDDLNAPDAPPHGCTKMYYTFDKWGQRSSTLTAFLPSTIARERRDRLHICTNTVVRRVEISKSGSGLSAEGVWIASSTGEGARLVKARREVVLSAGAVFSPHLLMLSGIGPAEHLKEQNIIVHKDLPAVGGNLQDHISVPIQFRIPLYDSLAMLVVRPWIAIKLFFLFIFFGTGLLLSPVLELPIFLQSRLLNGKYETAVTGSDDLDNSQAKNLPDIEIMPVSWADVTKHRQGGLSLFSIPLRPTSRGTVRLTSSDPLDAPLVDLNTLATQQDRATLRTAIRYSFALKARMAAHGYPIFNSQVPEREESASDDDLDAWAKTEMISASHYTSTCRMAPEDSRDIPAGGEGGGIPGGVVDARLRVHGVKGLRVADASVMPHILSTHLVATTVAIAEKCADMVKEDWCTELDAGEIEKETFAAGSQTGAEDGRRLRSRISLPVKSFKAASMLMNGVVSGSNDL
ncbi:alcohol oxidase [Coniophora puteana RWD-64-598 SS2]|uniref:Alcohol oxidase n=1 Tax=Coniophora puteana (strain RWD-64-598) TaxID=741705 RepID=A0A5M3ML53_CONPW|nr:alcohol oxidase [Coniophora puteana RWD-64-598 SS2]EIW79544.1 alcohol oxidase [Coniophora puteana RWD-64-598 SS2]